MDTTLHPGFLDRPFALFEDNLAPEPRLILLQDRTDVIRADSPADVTSALAAIEASRQAGD